MNCAPKAKFQPAVPLWFVGIEIVENNMDFPVGVFRYDLIHEIEKLTTSAPGIVSRL